MAFLTSKWALVVLGLLIVLVGLYVSGRKSVHSELVLPAAPEQVWAVLTNTSEYRSWNPVLIPVMGTLREGESVKYEFHQDESTIAEIPSTVKRMVENELLNQVGGMAGILTFDHRYQLEPVEGGTRVTIHEEYRGIFVPFWNPAPVEAAYQRLNHALRDRVVELYSP